ncbi:homeobox protein prophet of Pit-1-like [Platysternon megacephalum]|uniref:Homeobox protein prophet of Pit-1-like n=1 Tax=Platysternon megacephalum TaxID=55544 RepID=A0A4D9DKN4_9SAUR|nr:homeobox protein prophet of Pit-1-like [Platysternon megacephalum]
MRTLEGSRVEVPSGQHRLQSAWEREWQIQQQTMGMSRPQGQKGFTPLGPTAGKRVDLSGTDVLTPLRDREASRAGLERLPPEGKGIRPRGEALLPPPRGTRASTGCKKRGQESARPGAREAPSAPGPGAGAASRAGELPGHCAGRGAGRSQGAPSSGEVKAGSGRGRRARPGRAGQAAPSEPAGRGGSEPGRGAASALMAAAAIPRPPSSPPPPPRARPRALREPPASAGPTRPRTRP